MKIVFLHHSTGKVIWDAGVKRWFEEYRRETGRTYRIDEAAFPRRSPYGWSNGPYDYWNIWVGNAGPKKYMKEPTLEILTKKYGVIVWKHCFPVSDIAPDTGEADIASEARRVENYKLQYIALKEKMREFPETMFLVWTGAALTAGATDEDSARRARAFFEWVRGEWDEKGDNIYLWDFRELETEGGLYLKDGYAAGPSDPHPGEAFARRVAPLLCRRIVDVIEGRGDESSLTGE
ncbi:MAG TPA: hypothetical protein VMX58_11155 [Patescibacteria group bacterium]|nr:hypothetical protein [Patescibacteria group bacterium]